MERSQRGGSDHLVTLRKRLLVQCELARGLRDGAKPAGAQRFKGRKRGVSNGSKCLSGSNNATLWKIRLPSARYIYVASMHFYPFTCPVR